MSDPVVGGTALVRQSVHSPNYIPGVQGWSIKIDGSAEFNNLVIRGEFDGNNFVINSAGMFVYSGTPALGNLLVSIAGTSGTDAHGNSYPAGVTDFGLMSIQSGDAHGGLIITMSVPTTLNPGTLTIFETAAGNGSIAMAVNGDTHARISVRASGAMQWSSGAAVADTFLQRASAALLQLLNTSLTVDQALSVGGVLTSTGGTVSTPSLVTTDTWTTATLGTGWAVIAGLQPVQYRLSADNMIEIVGCCQTSSATPAAAVFTLDANHRPATDQRGLFAVERVATPDVAHAVDIGTGGAFTLLNNLTVTARPLYIYARVPKS